MATENALSLLRSCLGQRRTKSDTKALTTTEELPPLILLDHSNEEQTQQLESSQPL